MVTHKVMTRVDTGKTAAYYTDGMDDYYAKDGTAMEWQGEGAKSLGLSGPVDKDRFKELLNGQISDTQRINRPQKSTDNRNIRTGLDLTIQAPKSVSIQALVAGDGRIIEAHNKAVSAAVAMAEKHAQARTKENGKTRVENTGNLTVAKFRHETNREKEPHLHTHAFVLNMTQRADGQWRALRNDEIVKMTKLLGAAYRAELAKEVQKLGYELRHEREGMFELAQISRDQLESFSTRSKKIEERLAEQGLTRETATNAQKQTANLETRKSKTNDDRGAIFKEWQKLAKEAGIDLKGRPDKSRDYSAQIEINKQVEIEAARRAVRYALNHHMERTAVVGERQLIDTAIKHGIGSADHTSIRAEMDRLKQSGFLIRGESRYKLAEAGKKDNPALTRVQWVERLKETGLSNEDAKNRVNQGIQKGGLLPIEAQYTTQTALARERSILSMERKGRNTAEPLMSKEQAAAKFEGGTLKPGQREAAEMILTTPNQIVGVQGSAGTGKTYMWASVSQPLSAAGYNVKALAPYGSQVKALREEGMTANTVASWLRGKEKDLDGRTILLVDEAGVVPARQMEQILRYAEQTGARVVLQGDTQQTKAIEAGRPFDQLQVAGMETAVIGDKAGDIQRQKNKELLTAVEWAAAGRADKAIRHITDIREIRDPLARREQIATDYAKLSPEERGKTIIVTGLNDARIDLNQRIRDKLELSGRGVDFNTLVRRDTTQEERRYSRNYRVGDMIQPEKDYKSGLQRNELYRVTDTGPGNRLTVVPEKGGDAVIFNPSQNTKISVYEPRQTELSVGDSVRITRNDAALDLSNGDRFTVKAVEEGKVTLSDGHKRVTLEAGKGEALHLSHAYATTVHSSQGLTVDRIMFDADTKSQTTAKDVFYVGISRARHEASIYTDDRSKLPKAISRENVKAAAMDLIKNKNHQHEYAPSLRNHNQANDTQRERRDPAEMER